MHLTKKLTSLALVAGVLLAMNATADTAEARRWVRRAYRAPVAVYRAPRVRIATPYYGPRAYRGFYGYRGFGYGRGVVVGGAGFGVRVGW